jgi:thiamine-phosphate pyrophosphorylase
MDAKLVAWARAVKAREMKSAWRSRLPVLWLFTDSGRLADPVGAASRLPRGLCGVVLRDDARPDRAAVARKLARICRERRLVLVVAGDRVLAASVRAGLHLRGGRGEAGRGNVGRGAARRWPGVVTSSAHGEAELLRARRAGADLAFLSPAFVTASHPGAGGLGPLRWAAMARRVMGMRDAGGMRVSALGGVDGGTIRRLAGCRIAGAIGALA